MLERVGRYLIGAGRMIQTFVWTTATKELTAYGDSDWAGDRENGKSTSGGAIMRGPHVIKTWSSSQQTVATSSGEAELYSISKAASQVTGMISMLADFNVTVSGKVLSDSSAAIGIASREGLGRTRHIRVQYLCLQERVGSKELKL